MPHAAVDRRQQGFTIVELAIVMVIVGALAGLAIPTYLGYLDKARLARCIAEIRYISRAVDSYKAAYDVFPDTLAEAGAGDIVDPWGNSYEYLNIAALSLPGNGGGNGGGSAGGNGNAGGANPGGAGAGGSGGSSPGGGASPSSAPASSPSGSGGSAVPSNSTTPGHSGAGGGSSSPASHGSAPTSFWFEPDSAYAAQGGGGNASKGKPRKDRFLHPINSDYDLYSMGKDGESVEPLTAKKSHDDVIRANDGSFVGLAVEF